MPRHPRLHVPGGLYHAILRGNHRQEIFHAEADYLAFEAILGAALNRFGARLHAYCWMPNHVHLAVRVADAPLGRLMHLLASRYARRKQRQVPTTGHLFERRYRAKLVASDRYLLALVRYIHLNPVRAGLTADPGAYRWSSHRAFLGLAPTDLLDIELGMDGQAGSRVTTYQAFMASEPAVDEFDHIHPAAKPPRRILLAQPGCTEDAPAVPPLRDLAAIVLEVARESGLAVTEIRSPGRRPSLVRARAEIARRALREGVASLSQVALHLGRAPSSLSELLGKPGVSR
jgi:REP element-mobilizing transposase RayT